MEGIATDAQARAIRTAAKLALYRQDFVSFAAEQLRIKTADQHIRPFQLKPAQLRMWQTVEARLRETGMVREVWLKPRQIGASTLARGICFWMTGLREGVESFCIANEKSVSERLYDMDRIFVESMDPDIRPMRRYDTTRLLVFENPDDRTRPDNPGLRSRIMVATAENVQSGAGRTVTVLHMSEVARFVRNTDLIRSSILPAVHDVPGTCIIAESTAQMGGQWFKELCEMAQAGEAGWQFQFSPWTEEAEYQLQLTVPDAQFLAELDEEEHFLHAEHGVGLRQLNWRRKRIAELGSDDLFRQEFPLCVAAETRVSTERGILCIADALGCQQTESGRIVRSGLQPASRVLKLTTVGGRTLRGTADHPVMTTTGLKGLADLVPGDEVVLRPPMFSESKFTEEWTTGAIWCCLDITPDWGRLLGYFAGDGSLYNRTLSIACDGKDKDVVADVALLVRRLIGEPGIKEVHHADGTEGAFVVEVSSEYARVVLGKLGMLLGPDEKGYQKRRVCVPDCIFQSPRHVVAQFLRGLFEADGSSSGNRVRWMSKDRQFASDVQLLLLGFGINARVFVRLQKGGSFTAYSIELTREQSALFMERIGFVGVRKGSLHVAGSLTGRPRTAQRMVDAVSEVREDGFEETYDFTTDSHLFSANGILTHNTPQEAWLKAGSLLLDGYTLNKLQAEVAKPSVVGNIMDAPPRVIEDRWGELRIWELPEPGVRYYMGVDVSTGEGADYSSVCVIRRDTMTQVAEMNFKCGPFELAEQYLWPLGLFYMKAQICIEVEGPGVGTNDAIVRMGYPNVYRWRYRDDVSPKPTRRTGWHMTYRSKQLLTAFSSRMLRVDKAHIRSEQLYEQLANFGRAFTGGGAPTFSALPGCHDDLVIAFFLAMVAAGDDSFDLFYRGASIEPRAEEAKAWLDPRTHDLSGYAILSEEPERAAPASVLLTRWN